MRTAADPAIDRAVEDFVKFAQQTVNSKHTQPPLLSIMWGRKYARIVMDDVSAFGFVNRKNGDLLMAASWGSPAKHARGNVLDKSTWADFHDAYGMAYMRMAAHLPGKEKTVFYLNKGDGVASRVFHRRDGKFAVVLRDIDAQEDHPQVRIFPPDRQADADAYAKKLAGPGARRSMRAAVVRPNDTFVDIQKAFWDVVGDKMGVKFGAVAFNGRQLEIPWSNDEWGTGAVKMNFTTGYLILTWESDQVFKVEIKRLNTRPATTVAAWLKRAILAKAAGSQFKLPPKEKTAQGAVPQAVKDRAEEIKKKNPSYDEAKAFATAWSIYCRYTNPDSPHCKKDSPGEYFPSREARLRSSVIRLAHERPDFRPHLLPLLRHQGKKASQRAAGPNVILRLDTRAFSVKDVPKDPYGQVYDAAILIDRGAKRAFKVALQVVADNWDKLLRMGAMYDVVRFVDAEVKAQISKTPRWHTYSMPD